MTLEKQIVLRGTGLQQVFGETALDFPDLELARGETLLLLGPSGCGKTTLLHLLAGLQQPKAGKVLLREQDLASLSATKRDRLRGREVGMVFQQAHLIPALSVKENLQLARRLAGLKKDKSFLEKTLGTLGLSGQADHKPHQLSQGQAQRAAIARALMGQPAILMADEPTASLDDENARNVARLLQEASRRHEAALLIVTHDSRVKDVLPQARVLQL